MVISLCKSLSAFQKAFRPTSADWEPDDTFQGLSSLKCARTHRSSKCASTQMAILQNAPPDTQSLTRTSAGLGWDVKTTAVQILDAGSWPSAAICHGLARVYTWTEPDSVFFRQSRGHRTRIHFSFRPSSISVCYPGHCVNCGVGWSPVVKRPVVALLSRLLRVKDEPQILTRDTPVEGTLCDCLGY